MIGENRTEPLRKYLRRWFYLSRKQISSERLLVAINGMRRDYGNGWEKADIFCRLKTDGITKILDFEIIEKLKEG